MALTVQQRFSPKRFMLGEAAAEQPLTLTHRRIFILPTARGLAASLLLLAMLAAATVYGNNLGFILTFMLASVAVVSILHSFRALSGLRFSTRPCQPVFAGERAVVDCHIENPSNTPRISLCVSVKRADSVMIDAAPHAVSQAQLSLETTQRGWFRLGTITIHTSFPLGLFRAWSPIRLDQRVLVYPRPSDRELPRPMQHRPSEQNGRRITGDDDFAGFKTYQPGDSVKRVHWKALAKEQGLHTKQFDGDQSSVVWLDWARTPGASVEARLSQLCRWVLAAEQDAAHYGLALPSGRLKPGSGAAHRNRCLKALALYGVDDDPD